MHFAKKTSISCLLKVNSYKKFQNWSFANVISNNLIIILAHKSFNAFNKII